MHKSIVLFVAMSLTPEIVIAQLPDDSPRMSPLVRVVAQVEPAVVALFIPDPDDNRRFSSGSGTILHPDGYAITNNHVVKGETGLAVLRGKAVRFKVVGRSPEKDLAIIKLRDHQGHLPIVPLGHSHDVLNGETVAVVGNPGGRGTIVTAGIISAKGTHLTSPSALWASQTETKWRDDFIQYDAATNRGNSGGALINMDGELIGVVAALIPGEQNSSFAIPIDRVRRLLERIVEPELIHQRSVGIGLNPLADSALVTSVTSGSPADKAGVHTFDVLQSVDGRPLSNAADWLWTLDACLSGGDAISVVVRRGEQILPIEITPSKSGVVRAAEVPAETELNAGLSFEFFDGEFSVLPDFAQLAQSRKGSVESLDLKAIQGDTEDNFAVKLKGFMKVDDPGLYRVSLNSDDGSRLVFHGDVLINNDGNHPPMTLSRLVRVAAGLHPIEIEYFESSGENVLELKLERLDATKNGVAVPVSVSFMH
ncbi:putative serine protease HtrA [Rubripirellula tenax]|uniref:Putative serine protease HtrA n=1 Tax=Rubripirellula tenax TaxID=2528015 RepID=A0A5C6FDE3_9BACT|nr:trypsin-like peptidase domain-containing protein [Rubripirellula tenax]TWU58762.1 putative serine protease HtrA [Rubripirellula tenax]